MDDRDVIRYSAKEEYTFLKGLYKEENVFISDITRLEALGFHGITKEQQEYFNSIFTVISFIPISTNIIETVIKLRRKYNLSVGDSIISATADLNDLSMYTNNEDDFKNISEIKIFNPITGARGIQSSTYAKGFLLWKVYEFIRPSPRTSIPHRRRYKN